MASVEVICDPQQWDAIADEWAALDATGLCEPCTSLEWTQALLQSHVIDSDTVFAVVLRSGGRTLAIVPAVIRRERVLGPLVAATLTLLPDLSPTHSDVLRASDRDDVLGDLFGALDQLPYRWDVLRIRRLLETNPLTDRIIDVLARSRRPHRIRRENPSYVLGLEHGYDGFLASRSSKFRNYLRRKTRRLEAAGRLEVRRAGRDLPVEQAWQHLLAIEERSWKHARGTAISAVPRQREFYRLLCEGAARTGRLHLTVMYLDDRPIAFNLGITAGDRYSYLKTSFDEGLKPFSPATVLRAHLVESLCAEGLRCLDFPAQSYQWEEQWADRLRWRWSVLVFNRTPLGMLYRLLIGVVDWVRSVRKAAKADADDQRQPGDD